MLRPLHRRTLTMALALPLSILVAGCGQDSTTTGKLKTRETLNKTTQDVRELKAELAKGGILASTQIEVDDPLSQSASAYRTQVAKIAQMRVKMDMDTYEALNGEKPKTYEEFMELIIKKGKAEGIQLPMLPYYQEYAYDSDKKELVVVEYPAKKKAMQEQSDKALGRK